MRLSYGVVFWFVLTILLPIASHAQSPFHHQVPHFSALLDQEKSLTIEDIAQLSDSDFRPVSKAGYVGGYNRFHHWLKFTIYPAENSSNPLIMRVSPTYLDEVTLYLPDNQGGFKSFVSGDTVETRENKSDRALLFEIGVLQQPVTAYIQFHAINTNTLVADIYSLASYRDALLLDYSLSGIFMGLLLALIFVNLGYGQWRTDKSFRHYLLFVIASLLVFIAVHGWIHYFLADKWRMFGNYLPQITTLIYLLVLNLVHHSLFKFERQQTPAYFGISKLYQLFVLIGFVALLFDFYIEYMPWFMKITLVYLLLIAGYALKLTL